MNKKAAADIDPRAIAADFFKRLGGMAGMTKWGKTHRSLAYQLIAKLMAQPQVVNNNVNVITERDGESARRKLEDFMMRQINARGLATGAVYVNDMLINPDYIEHEPQAAGPRPVTADESPVTADPRPQPPASAPRPPAAAPVNIATGEPSTTAKYLEWSNNSSSQWWANLPGRVK
jgi:hypothetical protein